MQQVKRLDSEAESMIPSTKLKNIGCARPGRRRMLIHGADAPAEPQSGDCMKGGV